jgi:NADH-quinone oxidoreductase subunit N
VNSVVAFGYYGRILREMWMKPAPDGDESPVRVPQPLAVALAITAVSTLAIGVVPQIVLRYGNLAEIITGA